MSFLLVFRGPRRKKISIGDLSFSPSTAASELCTWGQLFTLSEPPLPCLYNRNNSCFAGTLKDQREWVWGAYSGYSINAHHCKSTCPLNHQGQKKAVFPFYAPMSMVYILVDGVLPLLETNLAPRKFWVLSGGAWASRVWPSRHRGSSEKGLFWVRLCLCPSPSMAGGAPTLLSGGHTWPLRAPRRARISALRPLNCCQRG